MHTHEQNKKNQDVAVAESLGADFDYAPSIESTDIVKINPKNKLFIGGKFVESSDKKYFKTENPATGEVLADLSEATAKDVDTAVKAARKAFGPWSKLSGQERGRYLYRIARIIQERSRELAVLETLDNGKPIREYRDLDIPLVSAHFFYYE
jgi:aldehyde dehydrogenase (NAD+)